MLLSAHSGNERMRYLLSACVMWIFLRDAGKRCVSHQCTADVVCFRPSTLPSFKGTTEFGVVGNVHHRDV